MAEDYFGDDEAPTATAAPPETETADEGGDYKTALIDSAICPGMEPGEEMVVKIEKVMDGEYLVSYAPEPSDEEEETAPSEEEPPPPGGYRGGTSGAMGAMME